MKKILFLLFVICSISWQPSIVNAQTDTWQDLLSLPWYTASIPSENSCKSIASESVIVSPTKGSIECLFQKPDGSPFIPPSGFGKNFNCEIKVKSRIQPSYNWTTSYLNRLDNANSNMTFEIASFPKSTTQIVFSFCGEGYRRCDPVTVNILPGEIASPSRPVLRLRNYEEIIWKVVDARNQPIASAEIEIFEDDNIIKCGLTNASGEILLPEKAGEPDGKATIHIEANYRSKYVPAKTGEILREQTFTLPNAVGPNLYKQVPVRLSPIFPIYCKDSRIEFQLLDQDTDFPIASSVVTIRNLSAIWNDIYPKNSSSSITDKNGKVQQTGLMSGWNIFSLSVPGYGRDLKSQETYQLYQPTFFWPSQTNVEQVVRLRRGKSFKVQIFDKEGNPKKQFRAIFGRIPNQELLRWHAISKVTDNEGIMDFDDISFLMLCAPYPNKDGIKLIPIASLTEREIVKIYEPDKKLSEGDLEVSLKNELGQPFVESSPSYCLAGKEYYCSSGASVDDNGKFRLTLPIGDYSIYFYGDYCSEKLEFKIEANALTSINAAMRKKKSFFIQLNAVNSQKEPVEGLDLRLTYPYAIDHEVKYSSSGKIDLRISICPSKKKMEIKFLLFQPSTKENPEVKFPIQSVEVNLEKVRNNELAMVKELIIPHFGELKFSMPASATGGIFSSVISPGNANDNDIKRVENFKIATQGQKISVKNLFPGNYWLSVSNDEKIALGVGKGAGHLCSNDCFPAYFHPDGKFSMIHFNIKEDRVTELEIPTLLPLATIIGNVPTRIGKSNVKPGTEWQVWETNSEHTLYPFIEGNLRLVAAGKNKGRFPDFHLPIYIHGICYGQVPPGVYEFYDAPEPPGEPVFLGKATLKPGKEVTFKQLFPGNL